MNRTKSVKVKEKKVKVKREKRKGFFGSAVDFLADKIYGFFENSPIGAFFTGGDRFNATLDDSFIHRFYVGIKGKVSRKFKKEPKKAGISDDLGDGVGIFNESTVGTSVKTKINRAFGSSVLLNAINGFFARLVSLPVMSYGLFLLSFGISVTATQAIKLFTADFPARTVFTLAQGMLILMISIPAFMTREESITECFSRSIIGSFILYDVMGVRKERKYPEKGDARIGALLFMTGVVLGVLSYYCSPGAILLSAVILIFAIRTVYVPELGVLLGIVLIPFVKLTANPALVCFIYSIFLFVCFILKFIAGKRSADFTFTDFLVVLFAIICTTTSWASRNGRNTALLYISFMLTYYVVRNLIRSAKWEECCVNAWIISSCAVSLAAIAEVVIEKSIYVTSVFDAQTELAWYLCVAVVITAAKIFKSEKHKPFYAGALAVQIFAMLGSGTWLVLIVTCFALIFFSMVCSRKTIGALIVILVAVPFVSCFISGVHMADFWRLVAFRDPSQAYKVEIWNISSRIAGDHILIGTGLGKDTFGSVFAGYAPEGITSQSSMSLVLQLLIQLGIVGVMFFASVIVAVSVKAFTLYGKYGSGSSHAVYGAAYLTAVLSLSLLGIFYDIWDSEPIALMFWMLLGCCFSCAKCAELKDNYDRNMLDDYSADMSISYKTANSRKKRKSPHPVKDRVKLPKKG